MNLSSLQRLAFVGALLAGWSTGARATTYTVSNLSDNGAGSLRQAILHVNDTPGADTILFFAGLKGNLTLTSGALSINGDLSIIGPGADVLALNGGGFDRIFNISGGHVSISGLTLRNGHLVGDQGANGSGIARAERNSNKGFTYIGNPGGAGSAVSGGAIFNSGQLNLSHVVLSHNTATGGDGGTGSRPRTSVPEDGSVPGNGGAGGWAGGGAIYNRGILTLSGTSFVSNQALGGNGGPGGIGFGGLGPGGVGGNALGGAILNEGTLQLSGANFADNAVIAGQGGRIGNYESAGGHYIGFDIYTPANYKAPIAKSLVIAGRQNRSLRAQLQASSQGAPLIYSLVSALPGGLSLDTTTGVVSGTPSVAGIGRTTRYTVNDGFGTSAVATLTFDVESVPSTSLPIISVNSPSITEANSGTKALTFTLTLSQASTKEVSVLVNTLQGSAEAGSDYVSVGRATVIFAPGVISQRFVVQVKGDTLVEGNEQFQLSLRSPVNATLDTISGIGTILNDDGPAKSNAFADSGDYS